MNIRNLTPQDRFDLIMECRSSGLTDYQWLKENGVSRSTFYYWISQFRKNGHPNIDEIPKPLKQSSPHRAQPQEVVKINVVPDGPLERNAPMQRAYSNIDSVMEIISGNTVIRLSNGTDPCLLETVLRSLGGVI
ncbi:MAG: transposase [Mogibacterium sp.]|nr:transposase [Mogibacterium sp.]